MEDFKGYIFMIIAILSAIVSIYQKSKKKGQQSKTLSSPRPKPLEPWKDIFDTDDENNTTQTFGGDRYDKSSIDDYKQEAAGSLDRYSNRQYEGDKNIDDSTAPIFLSGISISDMHDGLAVSKSIHTHKTDTPNTDDSRHIDVSLDTPTDWQRAFIYSEIFDRKY
ncbi:MAG: hypothetical protein ACFNVV_01660 [Bacteroidota bacterium]